MTFVMALHTMDGASTICMRFRTISGIAIPLFFMVSGFLLITHYKGHRYSIHKITRIVTFVLILALPIAIIRRAIHPEYLFDLKSWIIDIIGPFFQRSVLWVLWYLGAMCIIYTILPVIYFTYKKVGNIFLILSTFVMAIICNTCFSINITFGFEQATFQTLRIYNWLLYFFMGASINVLLSNIKITLKPLLKKQAFCFLTPALLAASYSLFIQYIGYPNNTGIDFCFGSAMCMAYSLVTFICVFFYQPGEFITKWVKILSNLFLPAYVLHVFIIAALSKVIPNTIFGDYIYIIKFIIVWIVTLSISYLVMKTKIGRWIFRI